jgi:hypothetical protein
MKKQSVNSSTLQVEIHQKFDGAYFDLVPFYKSPLRPKQIWVIFKSQNWGHNLIKNYKRKILIHMSNLLELNDTKRDKIQYFST